MAIRLTPPTKNIFYLSIVCAVVAIVLYILGVLGVIGGGFAAVAHLAFWIGILGWALLMAGVDIKLHKNVDIMPNIKYTFYDTNDEGIRPDDDVYLNLTLSVTLP